MLSIPRLDLLVSSTHPFPPCFLAANDARLTAWSASYPASALDSEQLPQTWKDALDAAVADGRIPNLPPSTIDEEGFTVYPDHLDPAGPEVCSSTFKCMTGEGVVWDAPDGFIGIGFDDGPELVNIPFTSTTVHILIIVFRERESSSIIWRNNSRPPPTSSSVPKFWAIPRAS